MIAINAKYKTVKQIASRIICNQVYISNFIFEITTKKYCLFLDTRSAHLLAISFYTYILFANKKKKITLNSAMMDIYSFVCEMVFLPRFFIYQSMFFLYTNIILCVFRAQSVITAWTFCWRVFGIVVVYNAWIECLFRCA